MNQKLFLMALLALFMVACQEEKSENNAQAEVKAQQEVPDAQTQDLTKLGVEEKTLGKGLMVGDDAPEIAGKDQNGNEVSLHEMLKSGPVAVVFYRGYWCPVCNRELKGLQENLDQITAAGGQLLVVSPEQLKGAQKISEKVGASFSIIPNATQTVADYKVGFEVTEAYQQMIREKLSEDIAQNNGSDKAILPVPATFVVGQDGKVIYRQYDVNYKQRASAADIAAAMKG
ncbi:peroxiredoxin-like family protein [Persicobacter diffluens]|uniref:thioredoxin-dependent peroxiredoxin n=1 Tax=Persicobacter diffluens TaxID=981 RepID=A0AAN5ALM0_9BACT|nr:peroxiredoxin [Persicobacter diffluens]